MRFFIFLLLSAITVLSACSNGDRIANSSDYRLCKHLATKPSYNIHYKKVKAEVQSRGVSCKKYAKKIDAQLDAERLARASAPRVTSNSNSDFWKTDIWDEDEENISDLQRRVKRLEGPSGNCVVRAGVPCM